MHKGAGSKRHTAWLCMLMALLCLLPALSSPAFANDTITGYTIASGFDCVGGSPVGKLYSGNACTGNPADGQVFSRFVCEFERIIQEVLSQVYCAIIDQADGPITIALTLLVMFYGFALLMGVSPFTAKELMMLAAKFSLVLGFALNADLMIGYGYALIMGLAQEGIIIVLSTLFQGEEGGYAQGGDVYKYFDEMIAQIFQMSAEGTKVESKCSNALFSMITLLAAVVPPVFFIAAYFMFRMAWVILRAVYGYCLGILGVTFLVTLAPIYIGFSLFKPTRTLFDKWLQYLISFAFQMVVVFAFLGMVFSIVRQMSDDVQVYADLVRPYDRQIHSGGVASAWNVCGICELNPASPKEAPTCKSDKVLHPSELVKDTVFLEFVSVKIMSLLIIFYLLDILMDFVPQMARYLAGPKYAGQIGGGTTGGVNVDLTMPGEKLINTTNAGFIEGYARGSTTPGALVSGFITATEYTVLGNQGTSQGQKQHPGMMDQFAEWIANPNRDWRQ